MKFEGERACSGDTALLLIDLQHAFLHQSGENYYPNARDIIEPCLQLVDAARRGNRLIVYVVDRHRSGFNDFEQLKIPPHGLDATIDAQLIEEITVRADRPELVLPKRASI